MRSLRALRCLPIIVFARWQQRERCRSGSSQESPSPNLQRRRRGRLLAEHHLVDLRVHRVHTLSGQPKRRAVTRHTANANGLENILQRVGEQRHAGKTHGSAHALERMKNPHQRLCVAILKRAGQHALGLGHHPPSLVHEQRTISASIHSLKVARLSAPQGSRTCTS